MNATQYVETKSSLVVVAFKTDDAQLQERLAKILEAALPTDPMAEATVIAKDVDELTAADLGTVAELIGWDATRRLQVGDVVGDGTQEWRVGTSGFHVVAPL